MPRTRFSLSMSKNWNISTETNIWKAPNITFRTTIGGIVCNKRVLYDKRLPYTLKPQNKSPFLKYLDRVGRATVFSGLPRPKHFALTSWCFYKDTARMKDFRERYNCSSLKLKQNILFLSNTDCITRNTFKQNGILLKCLQCATKFSFLVIVLFT